LGKPLCVTFACASVVRAFESIRSYRQRGRRQGKGTWETRKNGEWGTGNGEERGRKGGGGKNLDDDDDVDERIHLVPEPPGAKTKKT
jgi:hypothetical protein